MTTRPYPAVSSPGSRMARHGMPLVAIGTVGLICGPRTGSEQLAHMRALGEAWQMAVGAWLMSGATYCFFLADQDDEGAAHRFARPITFWTNDRAEIEHSVWSTVVLRVERPWVIDSLEPAFDGFIDTLKASQRLPAGHA
jgi:hypothetical protein